jgi:hypothetical protein
MLHEPVFLMKENTFKHKNLFSCVQFLLSPRIEGGGLEA